MHKSRLMHVQLELLGHTTERTIMSIIDVDEYATEEEVQRFRILFCDRPSDITGDEGTTRYNVAAQLMIENSKEDDRDLSTDEAKREFLGCTFLIYNSLNSLARDIFMDKPLLRTDFLKYTGALWRTIDEENIRRTFAQDPTELARILEARAYKEPRRQKTS